MVIHKAITGNLPQAQFLTTRRNVVRICQDNVTLEKVTPRRGRSATNNGNGRIERNEHKRTLSHGDATLFFFRKKIVAVVVVVVALHGELVGESASIDAPLLEKRKSSLSPRLVT